MTETIFMKDYPEHWGTTEVMNAFQSRNCSRIRHVRINEDKKHTFIQFYSVQDAVDALKLMENYPMPSTTTTTTEVKYIYFSFDKLKRERGRTQIAIKNLDKAVTEDDITNFLIKYNCNSNVIAIRRTIGTTIGYVDFNTSVTVEQMINKLNNNKLNNKNVIVTSGQSSLINDNNNKIIPKTTITTSSTTTPLNENNKRNDVDVIFQSKKPRKKKAFTKTTPPPTTITNSVVIEADSKIIEGVTYKKLEIEKSLITKDLRIFNDSTKKYELVPLAKGLKILDGNVWTPIKK